MLWRDGIVVLLLLAPLAGAAILAYRRLASGMRQAAGLRRAEAAVALVFAVLFAAVGGTKPGSAPERMARRLAARLTTAVFPFGRPTWPFDEATAAVVAERGASKLPPVPDDMVDTGVSLYRVATNVVVPEMEGPRKVISEWLGYDADNRGVNIGLPFAFPFGGDSYTNVGVLSNGRLAFGYATLDRRGGRGLPLEASRGELAIAAPFWGDFLLAEATGAQVSTFADEESFSVVWENLALPPPGSAAGLTVACVLDRCGRLSWYYGQMPMQAVTNATAGVQCGTNGWNFVNGGDPAPVAALMASSMRVDLVPVGGAEWAAADFDGDGLPNGDEFLLGTDPYAADSDGDGPDDRWELVHGYPPDVPASSPPSADSDGDGVSDAWEIAMGTDPALATATWPCADGDCDGFTDDYETRWLGGDPDNPLEPPATNREDAALLVCEIESNLPCALQIATTNTLVEIPWVPGVSPAAQLVFVPVGERAVVRLSRTMETIAAPLLRGSAGDGGAGYWQASLALRDGDTYAPPAADGTFGRMWAEPLEGTYTGWIPPDADHGCEWNLECWRLSITPTVIDLCGMMGAYELSVDETSFYRGEIYWMVEDGDVIGVGSPIVVNPSAFPSGSYTVHATTSTNGFGVSTSATLHIRRLSFAEGDTINVAATDATTHKIELGAESYSPDGYEVTSTPPGIDSLHFVPADLEPGVAYRVHVRNGTCGSSDVTVNNITLVSETVSEWPEDRSRTELGVGEKVLVELKPILPESPTWFLTGPFSKINDSRSKCDVKIAATDEAGVATVTAVLSNGVSIEKQFSVVAPSWYCFAVPYLYTTPGYWTGSVGAETYLSVTLGPTNVCFGNVWLEELEAPSEMVLGCFSDLSLNQPHDHARGAFRPTQIDGHNYFTDSIGFGPAPKPEGGGYLEWNIPVRWWVPQAGCTTTNFHSLAYPSWKQTFDIMEDGTTTIRKFGTGIVRDLENLSTPLPFNGEWE